jgi:hypothetical protein
MTNTGPNLQKRIPAIVRARTTQFATFRRPYPNPIRAKHSSFAPKNWDPYAASKVAISLREMNFPLAEREAYFVTCSQFASFLLTPNSI